MVTNKRILLDTNIVIDILRGDLIMLKFLETFNTIYLPVIVCGELLYGLFNSTRRSKQEKGLRAFIGACKVLNSNQLVAEEYAAIKLQLKKNGTPIPENDIWIAAIGNVNNITILTRDTHFEYVENLQKIIITKDSNKTKKSKKQV